MDKLYHFLLCLLLAVFFDAEIALAVAITIEATQFEAYWRRWKGSAGLWKPFTTYWWGDTILDLLADALGIAAGLIIKAAWII